jgi:hypothetical protein
MSWYPGKNIVGNIKKRRATESDSENVNQFGVNQDLYSGGFYNNPEDMGSLFTGLMGYFMGAEPDEEGNIDMKKVGKQMQDASKRKGLLQIIQDMMTDTPLEEPYKYDSMGSTAQERHLLKARNKYPKSAYTNPWLSSTASKQMY